jgi:vacuolar-type H+-ATPase subunit H
MGQQGRRSTTGSGAGNPSDSDGLSTLLETERELTEALEHSDEESAAIVESARTRVRAMEQEFESSLAAELRDLDASQEAETAAAASRTADEARARARRLDEVPEDHVRDLAAAVLRDFLGVSPASGAKA